MRLEERGLVEVTIHDASGAPVRSLLRKELVPGIHDLRWDGKDAEDVEVPRGRYSYRVSVDDREVEQQPLWIP